MTTDETRPDPEVAPDVDATNGGASWRPATEPPTATSPSEPAAGTDPEPSDDEVLEGVQNGDVETGPTALPEGDGDPDDDLVGEPCTGDVDVDDLLDPADEEGAQ